MFHGLKYTSENKWEMIWNSPANFKWKKYCSTMHFTGWQGNVSYLDKEFAALNVIWFVYLVLSLLTKISDCFSVKVVSNIIYVLKIKNHQTNRCFGLWFKLLLLVITYKRYLSKGDGFGAVHILSDRYCLCCFQMPVCCLNPVCSSVGRIHGYVYCKKKKKKSDARHCFICLGDFKNAFVYILLREMVS